MNQSIMEKINNLEKKLEAVEIPAGAGIGGTAISIPWWIDGLTPWLQFFTLAGGSVIVFLTIIISIQRIIKNIKS